MNKPNNDTVRRLQSFGFDGTKLEPTKRLERWRRFGYRILLLGMTPEKFMDRFSIQHAVLYLVLIVFHTFFGIYEAIVVLFFCRSLLEQVSHAYITTYIFAFNFQWYFMLMNIRKFHEDEIYLENFGSTRHNLDFAEKVFDKNINKFLMYLAICSTWWVTNSSSHLFGPAIETLLSFLLNGEFIQVFVLPQVFSMPRWAQIIVYLCNAFSTLLILMYVIACYLIMGTRVLMIKTQCDILNEALRNDTGEDQNHSIKAYIKDHIVIIKAAKQLNRQSATLNGFIFTACYVEFATQLFAMTLFEPSGSYFFALVFDSLSIFLILAIQCWMASEITHSLESISTAIYETHWYQKDKDNTLNILIMTQMAQRSYFQTIWLGSLKVERAAALDLVRSSYAMYTFLMIFQSN